MIRIGFLMLRRKLQPGFVMVGISCFFSVVFRLVGMPWPFFLSAVTFFAAFTWFAFDAAGWPPSEQKRRALTRSAVVFLRLLCAIWYWLQSGHAVSLLAPSFPSPYFRLGRGLLSSGRDRAFSQATRRKVPSSLVRKPRSRAINEIAYRSIPNNRNGYCPNDAAGAWTCIVSFLAETLKK